MAKIYDISKLIEVQKSLNEAKRKLYDIEKELLKHGDAVYETDTKTLVVKDGKFTLTAT